MTYSVKDHIMMFPTFCNQLKKIKKDLQRELCSFLRFYVTFLPYLVVRRSRTRTTWSCTALSVTQSPWVAGEGWASWAGTPGCQRGAQCPQCTPTVTGRRAPGRQTCPQCVQLCAAERPLNNPCSVWWSPRRSLAQAWWSGQKVPHLLAARGGGEKRSL